MKTKMRQRGRWAPADIFTNCEKKSLDTAYTVTHPHCAVLYFPKDILQRFSSHKSTGYSKFKVKLTLTLTESGNNGSISLFLHNPGV